MVSINAPHPPFANVKRFSKRFRPEDMKLSDSFYQEKFKGQAPFYKEQAEYVSTRGVDEAAHKQYLANYYTMIANMDDQIGQVIAEFKRQGIWENTIVLFTSDHGDMMGAHRLFKKGTFPYDEIYRIPCILKLPSGMSSERKTVDDLVSSQSFSKTLIKLAGVNVPASFTGGDFVTSLSRKEHPADEMVFFEHYAASWGLHPFYGVRTRNMKYARYYGADNTEVLYDLKKDPLELNNLAGDA